MNAQHFMSFYAKDLLNGLKKNAKQWELVRRLTRQKVTGDALKFGVALLAVPTSSDAAELTALRPCCCHRRSRT